MKIKISVKAEISIDQDRCWRCEYCTDMPYCVLFQRKLQVDMGSAGVKKGSVIIRCQECLEAESNPSLF